MYLKQISDLSSLFDSTTDTNDLKLNLVALLVEAKHDLSANEFTKVENAAATVFSDNCGCADDLEEMYKIFETLSKYNIFDINSQKRIIENSPCNRWL